MKIVKVCVISLISLIFVLCLFASGKSNDLLGRAYLFQNKSSISGSTVSQSSSGHSKSPDLVIDIQDTIIVPDSSDFIIPREVVGANPGEDGYALDIMTLMSNLDPKSARSLLVKEMLELYISASNGDLDNATYHMSAATFAGIHNNETANSTFLDYYYLQNLGRFTSQDMTLSKFTGDMFKELRLLSNNQGVHYDANRDGLPDGPFQILNGYSESYRKSTMSGSLTTSDRSFDIFYFPDNLSWINHDISDLGKIYDLSSLTSQELAMFSAIKHSRGSINAQAFGIPYTAYGTVPFGNYVSASPQEILKEASVVVKDLIRAYNLYSPPIVSTDNTAQTAIAIMLLLKEGWYLSEDISTNLASRLNSRQGAVMCNLLFSMEEDYIEGMLPSDYLKKFVVKPWETEQMVLAGINESDYRRIYGLTEESYMDYYSWNFIYKVEDYTSSSYIQKISGLDPPVVHAWDFLALGEASAAGLTGDYILLKLMVEAGLSSYMGELSFDSTNPSNLYDILRSNNANTYDPRDNNPNLATSFNSLINQIGINTSNERLMVLWYAYKNSGHYYTYGGGGRPTAAKHYSTISFWYSNNLKYVNNVLYRTVNSTTYDSKKTADSELLYRGVRMFDCSSLASVALSLGTFTSSDNPVIWYTASGFLNKIKNPDKQGTVIVNIDGVSYDMGIYCASAGAYTVAEYLADPTLVEGGLQPGDILSMSEHAIVYLGTTQERLIISSDLTRRNLELSVGANKPLSIEAWDTGQLNGVKILTHPSKFYVFRTYAYD